MSEITKVAGGQRRHSAQEWAQWVRLCTQSGQKTKEFCHERGLAPSTFSYWRRRLREGSAGAAAVSRSGGGTVRGRGDGEDYRIRQCVHGSAPGYECYMAGSGDRCAVAIGALIMLGLTPETRVFVKTGATDLRLAFEGLRALVVNVIQRDPCSGFVFAFCNRARNRGKRSRNHVPAK